MVQELYEKDKVVSYPRTDCQHINEETKNYLDNLLGIETKEFIVGEVSAHHGIIPLTKEFNGTGNKKEIFDEILKVTMANTKDVLKYEELKISYNDWTQNINILIDEGYTTIYETKVKFNNELTIENIIDQVDDKVQNEYQLVSREVETKPLPLFTEATLISKMQNIGKDIEDEEEKKIYKDIEGIGTPATRGQIIAGLIDKKFIELNKKTLIPT